MRPNYLYVIAPGPVTDPSAAAGPCKLGVSVDPDRRLRELQTGYPTRLAVHHRQLVPSGIARSLERLLHRDIGHLKSTGEWFSIRVDEAIGFVRHTVIRYADVDDLRYRLGRGLI